MPGGQQFAVDPNNLPKAASESLFQSPTIAPVPQVISPNETPPSESAYDFMFNAQKPHQPTLLKLPQSLSMRLLVGLGGLLVVIVLIIVIASASKGQSNEAALISVAQDQQELIHLATNASSQTSLSSNNQTFVATANLTLANNSTQLNTYLKAVGYNVSLAEENLKISTGVDQTLTDAASSGDFNPTFDQIMQEQLKLYVDNINTAYIQTKGVNGRALLKSLYKQTNLLSTALSSGL